MKRVIITVVLIAANLVGFYAFNHWVQNKQLTRHSDAYGSYAAGK